ncbi:hypothetical protein VTO42DRAFT_6103 [Malbranchea cinnamomea]
MPLYAFGSNGSGQLGVGHAEDLSLPTKCLFAHDDVSERDQAPPVPEESRKCETHVDIGATAATAAAAAAEDDYVRSICAGGNHTLVLLTSGTVYAAGSNGGGRCAHDPATVDKLLRFSRVVVSDDGSSRGRLVDRFSAVSATWEASFLVDAEGARVYAVGSGSKGELGLGQKITETATPVRIPHFPPAGTKIVATASSGWHTVAVLSNGEVYGWGSARKGQLGKHGIQDKIYWSPTKIEDVPFPANQVACGREFTAITGDPVDGKIIILGSDKWAVQSAAPRSVPGYSRLFASWHNIYVHKEDGSLLSWGRNDRGQLPPSDTPKLSKAAVGSEHVIAVTESAELVACGWGEHGNCGPTTDAQGNVTGCWANIPLEVDKGKKIIAVGAGCATSWVVTK